MVRRNLSEIAKYRNELEVIDKKRARRGFERRLRVRQKMKGLTRERYRVTVARTVGDQPLNTRRSSCHARFMGRQRNRENTSNSLSLAHPTARPHHTHQRVSVATRQRCDVLFLIYVE